MSGEYTLKQRLRVGVFAHVPGTSRASPVYTGMRRATLLIVSVLLAVPALADAKGGVDFAQDPEVADVGTSIDFRVFAIREPRGPNGGEPHPVVGERPVVTFRSDSGKVIRVRASRTNENGIGYGTVKFTDKGPWTTELDLPGVHLGEEFSQPINAGQGLTTTETVISTPPPDPAPSPAKPDDGFPWVWVLGAAGLSLLVALAVAGMRRRGHWGTA